MYQFDESILEIDRSKVIEMLITKFEANDKARLQMLKRYYEGDHDKIMKKRTVKGKPNNKVINPFASLIVNTVQGYLVGQPIKYISENEKALERILDVCYSNDEEDLNSEIVKTMSVCGEAFEYIYINENKEIEFVQLPIDETILVYDNNLKAKSLMCVRYYETQNALNQKIQYAEVYTKDKIEYYKGPTYSQLELVDEYEHIFGQVPVIHYKNNEEMTGDFEKILTIIDDIDKVISSDSDEIEYFRNAYMLIKGLGKIDEKTMSELRQTGAFCIPTTNQSNSADVKFITKDLNTESVHKHLEVSVENIHKFSQVPNFVDQKAATAESGAAMKQKVWGFEQLTGIKQRKLEQGLFSRLRLMFRALKVLEGFNGEVNEFSLRFSRNLPTNVKEDVEILNLLGITADRVGEEALTDVLSKISILQEPKDAARHIKAAKVENNEMASLNN